MTPTLYYKIQVSPAERLCRRRHGVDTIAAIIATAGQSLGRGARAAVAQHTPVAARDPTTYIFFSFSFSDVPLYTFVRDNIVRPLYTIYKYIIVLYTGGILRTYVVMIIRPPKLMKDVTRSYCNNIIDRSYCCYDEHIRRNIDERDRKLSKNRSKITDTNRERDKRERIYNNIYNSLSL